MKVQTLNDKEIISALGRAKCAEILSILAYVPNEDVWTVQYSPLQDMFHIEPILMTCEKNHMIMFRAFTGLNGSDYILIALAKDHDTALKIVEQAKKMRKKLHREMAEKILSEEAV